MVILVRKWTVLRGFMGGRAMEIEIWKVNCCWSLQLLWGWLW
jgi:hypothetical protein